MEKQLEFSNKKSVDMLQVRNLSIVVTTLTNRNPYILNGAESDHKAILIH
jgi:hypothetical protein